MYGANVTLDECGRACDVAVGMSGACTGFNYNTTAATCFLYAQVKEYTTDATAAAYTQAAAAGMAAECAAGPLKLAWATVDKDAGWQSLARRLNKKVIFSAVGYQSRPFAYRAPAGIVRVGGVDCSCWNRCYDPSCQAALYTAFFEHFFTSAASGEIDGVFSNGWSLDPTAGGPSDSSHTVRAKPAEAIVRHWFGASPTIAAERRPTAERRHRAPASQQTAGKRNGFVFGTGEWSNPSIAPDSAAALESIDAAVGAGANALEFMVTWYFRTQYDTTIFRNTDEASPLRTEDDRALVNAMRYAKSTHNLTVAFTPFLDPFCNDYKNCSGESYDVVTTGAVWRGVLCQDFNADQWAAWFGQYSAFIVHYAALAQEAGADEYFITHELATCEQYGPVALWDALIDSVRSVFHGQVAAALNWGPFVTGQIVPSWTAKLDYIGVDCYFDLNVSFDNADPRWANPPLDVLLRHWDSMPEGGHTAPTSNYSWLSAMAAYSTATGGKTLVCTEVGYQSKPRPWLRPAGVYSADPESSIVVSEGIDTAAQALAYEALFSTFYPQPWFGGFYMWLWRSDPSAFFSGFIMFLNL